MTVRVKAPQAGYISKDRNNKKVEIASYQRINHQAKFLQPQRGAEEILLDDLFSDNTLILFDVGDLVCFCGI
jgi:hypothetical protein